MGQIPRFAAPRTEAPPPSTSATPPPNPPPHPIHCTHHADPDSRVATHRRPGGHRSKPSRISSPLNFGCRLDLKTATLHARNIGYNTKVCVYLYCGVRTGSKFVHFSAPPSSSRGSAIPRPLFLCREKCTSSSPPLSFVPWWPCHSSLA